MPPPIRYILGLLPIIACTAHAQSPDPALDLYAQPGKRVAIGENRHLNLRCSGKGSPTVILESGNNADSMAWFKVQPEIATFTRVCSCDRAGTGFSDGGPLPRNVDSNAADLASLIHAAPIATPVVLVGHSYGTNVVRRFADTHANEVAAMVLLDPPPQDVGEFSPEFEKADDAQRQQMLAAVRNCETAAESKKLDAHLPEFKDCLRPPNPQFSARLNAAMHANKLRPSFWRTIVSIAETNADLYKQPVSKSEAHGAIPLLILQPDTPFDDVPPEYRQAMEQARQKTQRAIAATSTRGKIVHVEHSSHDVQIDRPDAVVAAVRALVKP
ncbi:MAG: alpha/beta hydrolase [Proteobacteria bacterium]|nr:alpha/beta hydrolase [Pseudomonadota bacterium]